MEKGEDGGRGLEARGGRDGQAPLGRRVGQAPLAWVGQAPGRSPIASKTGVIWREVGNWATTTSSSSR